MKEAKNIQAKTDKEQAIKDARATDKANKEKTLKDAHAKMKAEKEQALKDAHAKEKASNESQTKAKLDHEKAQKEQASKDAKAQEKADKIKASKEAADAKRRLTQSLGNDDAEMNGLKGQVAAQTKANSIGKYKTQIESRIKTAWRVPSGTSGLKATARFTLSSDGTIASVVIIHSSGNDDFDQSIKALSGHNGLPVPDDSDVFRQVNPLVITFRAP
jgi:colicin import membrane protein